LIQRTDLDDKDINIEIVKKYADELNTQRILRSTVFGIDPFDQKYSKELIDQLKSDIGADQVKLNRLETKLVTLQKTWYARIRDSWSNFWSASRAKVASWRLW
jgi:hypothetical protein